jgi:hypothetical protein
MMGVFAYALFLVMQCPYWCAWCAVQRAVLKSEAFNKESDSGI